MKLTEVVVHGQPNFPRVDISETDAKTIRGILSDPSALKTFHDAAEDVHSHYSDTHDMVAATVATEFNAAWARAASVGLAAYEATTCMVQPDAPVIDRALCRVFYEQVFEPQITMRSLLKYLDMLRSEMSNTTAIVQTVARQYLDCKPEPVLLGAAISRVVDLKILELH